MTELQAEFISPGGFAETSSDSGRWPAIVIPSEVLDGEVERLASAPMPNDGRRRSLIVHPSSEPSAYGLAPGIQVAIEVLCPGERSLPIRHNSSVVNFCIQGSGYSVVEGRKIAFERYDVWNAPSFAKYWHVNDSNKLHVRLSYSNAALLERLNIHFVDEHPPEDEHGASHERDEASESREIEDIIPLSLDGASLMRYEGLINPAVVEQPVLHWPWRAVRPELDKLADLGADYRGRRLYLLYNPASGRTNGTTNSFFATITVRPPRIVDPPHRHSAAAINYYLSGSGYSRVDGERLEWKAGDLMFSAPGWATHNHASNDEVVYELTVQDTPFNLAIDSLMWQEDLTRPPILLGSHRGFMTNRASVDPTTVFPGRHQ